MTYNSRRAQELASYAMTREAGGGIHDALFRAYNTWLADFCNAFPDRLKGIAVVSLDDIERGMAETRHAADLGLRGVMVSSTPHWGSGRGESGGGKAEENRHPVQLQQDDQAEREQGGEKEPGVERA